MFDEYKQTHVKDNNIETKNFFRNPPESISLKGRHFLSGNFLC